MKEQECKDEFDPEMEGLSEKKPHEVNKNIEHDESKEFLKDNKNKEIIKIKNLIKNTISDVTEKVICIYYFMIKIITH
jgi:hypothetical protein